MLYERTLDEGSADAQLPAMLAEARARLAELRTEATP
jgi:hypothetical protein